VFDDPARRRLVVVRRDDEDAVRPGLVSLLGEVDRVRGGVRAGACDHGRPVSDRVERGAHQLHALLLGERGRLAGRAVDDDTVGAVVDEERAELSIAVVVDGAVRVERRHGRGQNLAEHETILRPAAASPCRAPNHPQGIPGDPLVGTLPRKV
jgi:hypothetical protein